MNNQIPSPRINSQGSSLLVHSIFHTIQGEGPFTGVPAVFIRLGGCNLQCPGCDTEYTNGAGILTIAEVFAKIGEVVNGSATRLVVITGGEPFRQNISILVNQLHYNKVRVQIETNGSMPPQGLFDLKPIIVCSPKTSKLNPKMIPLIDAYKYVVDHSSASDMDGLPLQALGHQATPHIARPHNDFGGTVYIQPMDMTAILMADQAEEDLRSYCERLTDVSACNKANLDWCVKSCMKYGYTLQVQLHKIINME